ncbi:MAG: hypothetical protein LBS07_05370 [Prevotellaceae bacterium]|nr:hypothetical protein [Prevotellaceae bacterium]
MNAASFANGLYLVSVIQNGKTYLKRLIVKQ